MNRATSDHPGRFILQVPTDPAHVATARMFSSAVARHFDAGEDVIEDLKLAVSEACSASMREGASSDQSIRITALHEPPTLWFEVSRPESDVGGDETSPLGFTDPGLGLEILQALFENAELRRSDDGRAVVRFAVPVPA